MNIAYVMAPGRGDTDLVMFGAAQRLAEQGLRLAGTVQVNTEKADGGPCDMDVQILPDGPTIRISQSLGRESRGCRLDPAALETAVGLTDKMLAQGADCLLLNKFGKHEAEGRGFRDTIAVALAQGIPVVMGANRLNLEALLEFTDNCAQQIPADETAIAQWVGGHRTVESSPA